MKRSLFQLLILWLKDLIFVNSSLVSNEKNDSKLDQNIWKKDDMIKLCRRYFITLIFYAIYNAILKYKYKNLLCFFLIYDEWYISKCKYDNHDNCRNMLKEKRYAHAIEKSKRKPFSIHLRC